MRPEDIRSEIDKALRVLEEYRMYIVAQRKKVMELQAQCDHLQMKPTHQVNTYCNTRWNITYTCPVCDHTKIREFVPPICFTCHTELLRVTGEAAEVAKVMWWSTTQNSFASPSTWTCPQCGGLQILEVLGD